MKSIKKYAIGALVFTFGISTTVLLFDRQTTKTAAVDRGGRTVTLATSSLPVAVTGVVAAAESVTIYARTAGIVTVLPHREGAVVSAGTVLALQDTPIEEAQVALAVAQGSMTATEQRAHVTAQETLRDTATVRAYTATEIAMLRAASNTHRLTETTAATAAAVNVGLTTTLAAMDYINNNRTLLTADGLDAYNEAVRLMYGNRATHFDTQFLSASKSVAGVTLQSVSAEAATSPVAAETAALMSEQILTLLNAALMSAEKDVFNRQSGTDEASTATYVAQKAAVTTALAELVSTRAAAAQVIDGALQDIVGEASAVAVTDIDRKAAVRQAALAEELAMRAVAVSNAAIGVATAATSLNEASAPFAGVVSRVYVKAGTYVMPGTPLVELVGTGAQEVVVTVPEVLVQALKVGQPFVVDGITVGIVDRFSPVAVGHGHVAVIALQTETVGIGGTVTGHVMMDARAPVYAVPRAYVHITSNGPSIMYQDGDRVPVEIVYDGGATLYVTTDRYKDAPLITAVSGAAWYD
jgi:multidrug resistance efflux pump